MGIDNTSISSGFLNLQYSTIFLLLSFSLLLPNQILRQLLPKMSDQDSADESDVQNGKNPDDRGLSPELGGAAVDVENALQTTETVQSLCTKFSHMSVSNTMNPYDLANNCVYITIAHLLGQNLHDYLTTTEQMQPPSSVKGISLDDVDAMLKQSGKQIL